MPTMNAAETARHLHLLGATGAVRTETKDGREYIVVPVVALMEGVIHAVNAETPEFVSAAVLQKAAASWNGKPVTLGHPKKNGTQCSANHPEVLSAHGIGVIRNSRMVGTKMLQEAWIDKARAKKLHPALHDRLLNGEREEVSVGAFVVTDAKQGEHGGKRYVGSWLETSGDHLAFLPGGRGACSIEMGCGAHRAASMRICEEDLKLLADAPDPEEQAELIGYQTLKTMSDSCMAACEQIAATVDALIAAEEDDATETSDEEDAEEEIEEAQLESIQALCSAMMSDCSAMMNLCYKLNMPDPEDMPQANIVRAMSNPEGINQYTHGSAAAAHDTAVKAHMRAIKNPANKDRANAASIAAYNATHAMEHPEALKSAHAAVNHSFDARGYMGSKQDHYDAIRAHETAAALHRTSMKTAEGLAKVVEIHVLAGARHSVADTKMIQAMHDTSMALGATCDRSNYKLLSNPEGINQYTTGGGGKGKEVKATVKRAPDPASGSGKSIAVSNHPSISEAKKEAQALADKTGIRHDVRTTEGNYFISSHHPLRGAETRDLRDITEKDRKKIPDSDFAGKGTSFPISKPEDVAAAAASIGRAGDGNYSTDKLKANIIAIAKRKGAAFVAQLPKAWQEPKAAEEHCGCKDTCTCHGGDKADKLNESKTVRSEGGQWAVYTLDGTVRLSTHGTRDEAVARRREIDERTKVAV